MRLLLLTSLTMLAFAANSVLNRMALQGGLIGPVDFGTIRVVSGAVALAALCLWQRGALPLRPQGRGVQVASLLIYIFGFTLAYGQLDAGLGALILFGMVQITMFAGALYGRESVPIPRWLGAGLAFAGLFYLLAPGEGAISLAHGALMVGAGVGWGIYSLAGRGATDALAATAANFIWAVPTAIVAGLAAAFWATQPEITPTGAALAVLSGALTSGLGYALWYAILPHLGAQRGAVAQLTVPVLASLGGILLLGEGLSTRMVIASALVLGGVALSLIRR